MLVAFQSFCDRMIFLSALEAWSDPPTSSQKEHPDGMHFFPNVKFPMNPSKSFWAVMKLGKKVHRRTRASRWSSRKTCLGQLAQPAQASQETPEFKVFSPATCSFYFVVISMFGIKLVVTLSNMLRFDFDTLQFDVMMNAKLEISSWLFRTLFSTQKFIFWPHSYFLRWSFFSFWWNLRQS